MKSLLRIGLCVVIAVLALSPVAATAQDSVAVAPQLHKVLVDNDKVRVYEVTLKPGDKLPMHSHPGGYAVYSLTGGKVRFTGSDGKAIDREMKQGEANWSDPVTHAAENTGTSASRVVVVELKAAKK